MGHSGPSYSPFCVSPDQKSLYVISNDNGATAIKFDASGNMLICEGADHGGRRVIRTDMKTGMSYIIAHEKGRIYFSDPRYFGHEPIEQALMGVYRIDPDGTIHRIISDAGKPNGVAEGPVAVAEPLRKGHMALMAYDLHEDGSATFRETLVDYAPEDGPDGLVCDADGNLVVAVRAESRPGIYFYSPKGKEIAYLETEVPTNVGFGRGKDSNLLYITAGSSLFKIRLNTRGYQLPAPK